MIAMLFNKEAIEDVFWFCVGWTPLIVGSIGMVGLAYVVVCAHNANELHGPDGIAAVIAAMCLGCLFLLGIIAGLPFGIETTKAVACGFRERRL